MDVNPSQLAMPRVFGGAVTALLVMILITGIGGSGIWWWRSMSAETIERLEHDHGLELPPSTRSIQAMSDIIRFFDHGRSAVFLVDSDEMPQLIEMLDQLPDVLESTFVPGNARYRPRILPWPPGSEPTHTFGKKSPAGGDWLYVEIYSVDETSNGVWLYSDWN